MSKILKNYTNDIVAVGDTGVVVPANGQYVINPQDYWVFAASSDIVTLVGNSTLVVNDGSYDLLISDGIDLIKGIHSKKVQIVGNDIDVIADVMEIGADGIKRLRTDSGYGVSSFYPQDIDIEKLMPIGYGASLTVPAFPTIKPLGHYTVPTGKRFRLFGVMFKTSGAANYLHLYTRTELWKFAATSLSTPNAPTLTAKTIGGSGLTTLATYRYAIVANNIIGNTLPSSDATVTLTGTQNAVTLTWTNIVGALDYEIYRTPANGATGTKKLLATTDQLTFTDILSDSDLDIDSPPVSSTTAGSVDAGAYSVNYGATQVVVDTMSPITTATDLNIIYANIYGEKNFVMVKPSTVAGGQVAIQLRGLSNPLDSKRIKKGVPNKNKKRIFDVGMNDIIAVSNTPATGSFVIYGHNHFFHMASQQSNKWDTIYFESTLVFKEDSEIIFGISGNTASTATTRNDVVLLGTLE